MAEDKEKYPDGKLGDDDEGVLKMVIYANKGRCVIDFGKKTSWIGFDKDNLRTFIDTLEKNYKSL